ncbi:MAG: MarR family transcriptional regulator [Halobacteriovoraceae bacterium]|nr:MarR family transcriptional regulator [Halobacteriovoraceae bacterium]
MSKLSSIGTLLKKIYRSYNLELLSLVEQKGFTDLRASFLEVLIYICHGDGPTIKEIGQACGLKKQTMTSHLNELEKRGYVIKKTNSTDKREQKVFLTDYGHKFKLVLDESILELEKQHLDLVGEVEFDRIEHILNNYHYKLINKQSTPNLIPNHISFPTDF